MVEVNSSSSRSTLIPAWLHLVVVDNDGRIIGSDAIKFFGMSSLSRQDLKQLVSLVQEGRQISHCLMNGDVGFENINPPAMECLNTLIMRKKQSSKSRAPERNCMTF
ncbi:hypothetical protein V6N13_103403 [Hibiscus sabdariffa]|uniref:Uncharacterized protein n=1 Tax=Hibiscus sabdariffa TaxID=183260 RepID=A0ABR2BI15_9ROSI